MGREKSGFFHVHSGERVAAKVSGVSLTAGAPAVLIKAFSEATFNRCLLHDNQVTRAPTAGGAVYCEGTPLVASFPALDDCECRDYRAY
jgi:hypothetical protein